MKMIQTLVVAAGLFALYIAAQLLAPTLLDRSLSPYLVREFAGIAVASVGMGALAMVLAMNESKLAMALKKRPLLRPLYRLQQWLMG